MIRIDDLAFGYRRAPLFQHFSLRLDQPGIHGVFGRNGSGKSTLLKLLSGLLFPRKGRIEVLGHEPRRRHPDFLAQVYLVPEEFHLPDLSVDRLARTHGRFYPRFDASALRAYLEAFELEHDRPFGEMSLGGKKKAVLAFALSTFTPVLLLDEPTNGLDVLGRDQFRQLVARPEQQERMILISTHQARDLERILRHILFFDVARLALSAPMAEVARAIATGVSRDEAEVRALAGLIYHDAAGDGFGWVSRRSGGEPGQVDLELLYKALSRNRNAVLSAVHGDAGEGAHV